MSYTSQAPQPSLAWQFDGTTTDYLAGLAGTAVGSSPTYVTGKYGQAISITNTAGGTPTSNVTWTLPSISSSGVTVACWVNATTFSSSGTSEFIAITGINPESDIRVHFNSGTTSATVTGVYPFVSGAYIGATSSTSFTTGTWVHTAITITESSSGSNVCSFYVNGTFVGSSSSATSRPRTFNKFTVGSFCDGLFQSAFNGLVDDLRIYNTALSSSQIQSVYAAQGMPSRGVQSNSTYIKSATGGDTVQMINGYRIHTFTTVGTSTFTPATSGLVDVLVVAGGGGGGYDRAGGGGAGGLIYQSSFSVSAGAITVTVGDGGAGATSSAGNGTNGSNSVFGALTAVGGGGGGTYKAGSSGGSGGGGHGQQSAYTGGSGTAGQGFAGGSGSGLVTGSNSGGGGGAGGVGANGGTTVNPPGSGNGGAGLPFAISGTPTYYAGGGGGSIAFDSYSGTSDGGKGGIGGGGNAGQTRGANGSPGTSGTGGGGGGGANIPQGSGGKGGSGIVIVRYPISIPMTGTPLFTQLSSAATSSAVGAFSLRAVNGTTARAVQVKRSSDNATQDFWADRLGNLLTQPVTGQTLANWLGGSSGNVVTWYDQSGRGNHATQSTAANQPVIQKGTKGPGYSVLFNGTTNYLTGMSYTVLTGTNYSVSVVERRNTSASQLYFISSGDATGGTDKLLHLGYFNNTTIRFGQYLDDMDATISGYIANEPLHYWTFTESSTSGRYTFDKTNNVTTSDATKKTLLASTSGNFAIGWRVNSALYYSGEIYEVLVFTTSLYDLDNTGGLITQVYQNQLSYTGT